MWFYFVYGKKLFSIELQSSSNVFSFMTQLFLVPSLKQQKNNSENEASAASVQKSISNINALRFNCSRSLGICECRSLKKKALAILLTVTFWIHCPKKFFGIKRKMFRSKLLVESIIIIIMQSLLLSWHHFFLFCFATLLVHSKLTANGTQDDSTSKTILIIFLINKIGLWLLDP